MSVTVARVKSYVRLTFYISVCYGYLLESPEEINTFINIIPTPGFPLFSSPEPKVHGKLIVYQSSRRLSVCMSVCVSVNIFKLEYLRNQWANRNQILSEASLGWVKCCIGFSGR